MIGPLYGTDGGFVIHHIVGEHRGVVSAWFDINGKVENAEQILPNRRYTRPVKPNGTIWRFLESIGQSNKNPAL